ncbi:MAG: hypothetical protein ABEK50_07465 [bacterium]
MKNPLNADTFEESFFDPTSLSLDVSHFNLSTFSSKLNFLGSYLNHHLNNKLSVVEGNVRYARIMINELDNVETADRKSRLRIEAIKRGLREALDPIEDTLDKLRFIQSDVKKFLKLEDSFSE